MFVNCRASSTSTERLAFPGRDTTILHIDVDPMVVGTNYRTEVGMIGDARLALEALIAEVTPRLAWRRAVAVDGAVLAGKAQATRAAQLDALASSAERPIRPERVVKTAESPVAR